LDLSPHFPLQAAESGAVKWRSAARLHREMLAKFCLRPLCFRLLDAVFAILPGFFAVGLRRQAQHLQRRRGQFATLTTTQQGAQPQQRGSQTRLSRSSAERVSLTTIQISNPVMPRVRARFDGKCLCQFLASSFGIASCGSLVDVRGVSSAGTFAPLVASRKLV